MQRRRRQCRRTASKLYNRRNRTTPGENKSLDSAAIAVAEGIAEGPASDSATQNGLNSGKVEVRYLEQIFPSFIV